MKEKIELRLQPLNLKTEDEQMIVEGLVNKTESWSQTLGNVKRFKEKIVKGAFKKAIDEATVIDFLAEHEKSNLLSTTANDSLELWEDEEGLKMRARIIPTSYGKNFFTLIKEGVIAHMSFGFRVKQDNFKRLADGTYERVISALELLEVSAVRTPAYLASSINARNLELVEEVDVHIEEKSDEETDEERALNDELLAGILEQLKANNELLSQLKPVETVVKDEVKTPVEPTEKPVQETIEPIVEEQKEVEKEDKPTDIEEKPVDDVVEPNCPKSDESVAIEQHTEEDKKEEVKVDLSAQKDILAKILQEGEA